MLTRAIRSIHINEHPGRYLCFVIGLMFSMFFGILFWNQHFAEVSRDEALSAAITARYGELFRKGKVDHIVVECAVSSQPGNGAAGRLQGSIGSKYRMAEYDLQETCTPGTRVTARRDELDSITGTVRFSDKIIVASDSPKDADKVSAWFATLAEKSR